jgi:hypothetical protein
VPGTPINAAAVNSNFQALAGAINALGPTDRFTDVRAETTDRDQ